MLERKKGIRLANIQAYDYSEAPAAISVAPLNISGMETALVKQNKGIK